jgi:hypothetical protein
LWIGAGTKLYRFIPSDYREGVINFPQYAESPRPGSPPTAVDLLEQIIAVAPVGDVVFVATATGIYKVERGTLDYYLAYTISGGGGGGRNNTPPNGEVIAGNTAEINWMRGLALDVSHYLAVATRDGATIIRLYDDYAFTYVFPTLDMPTAWFNALLVN